jgi:hypothetical protein
VPALALLAGKRRIAALDSDGREQALHAVLAALAVGYVGVTALQPGGTDFDPGVDVAPKRLWQMWVARLNALKLTSWTPGWAKRLNPHLI